MGESAWTEEIMEGEPDVFGISIVTTYIQLYMCGMTQVNFLVLVLECREYGVLVLGAKLINLPTTVNIHSFSDVDLNKKVKRSPPL